MHQQPFNDGDRVPTFGQAAQRVQHRIPEEMKAGGPVKIEGSHRRPRSCGSVQMNRIVSVVDKDLFCPESVSSIDLDGITEQDQSCKGHPASLLQAMLGQIDSTEFNDNPQLDSKGKAG